MKADIEQDLTIAEKNELEARLASDPKMLELKATIEKLEKKKAQAEQRMKDKIAKESEKTRKERAHRLIILGGLIEKYFGCEIHEGDENFRRLEIMLPHIIKQSRTEDRDQIIRQNPMATIMVDEDE